MTDPIEQAFGRYNVAVTTGRDALPSANAYSALLDERRMAVVAAIRLHDPDMVRLVLAARRALPIIDDGEICNGCWRERCSTYAALTAALDPFKEVQE